MVPTIFIFPYGLQMPYLHCIQRIGFEKQKLMDVEIVSAFKIAAG